MLTNDIYTERLILRSTREEMGRLCVDLWLDPEVGKYLADPPREMASESYLSYGEGVETEEGWFPFTVFHRETGDFIGTCSVVPMEGGKRWDLGYCVCRDHWRQGYCTEMISALMDWGRREGAASFSANVAQENAGSNAVMQKLGFRVAAEGSFKKSGTDIVYQEYIYKRDA